MKREIEAYLEMLDADPSDVGTRLSLAEEYMDNEQFWAAAKELTFVIEGPTPLDNPLQIGPAYAQFAMALLWGGFR